jgi:DNA-binding NarL/FixJ family response regulator
VTSESGRIDPERSPIRVAIVDDHPMVIGGLKSALATCEDIVVAAQASTVGEAAQLLARRDLDVVLLDVRLADGNALQALAERGPGRLPAVLVISTFSSSQYIAASIRFGASGFISKTVALPRLLDAIRAVARGQSVYGAEQRGHAYVTLTPKEREVLRFAIDGLSNKEIGARIGTSRKTVEGHLSDIFAKYGITGGRTELSIRAATEGWLEVQPPGKAGRRR